MKTDITYDQLKPHLTKENRLWVEDDATWDTEGHETATNVWPRLFGCEKSSESLVTTVDGGDHFLHVLLSGRVFVVCYDANEIYQLPEAAMQELGLLPSDDPKTRVSASMSAAEELREALGEDVTATPGDRFDGVLLTLTNSSLFAACGYLRGVPGFFTWPAALGHHHAREGGLLEHTLEVIDIALHIAAKFPDVNKNVLIAAALWHDEGKLREYVIEHWDHPNALNPVVRPHHLVLKDEATGLTVWVRDPKAVHHCISSAQEFIVAARQHGVDRATEDAVVHCILSHHGPVKEWGSPVAPESLEAIILHQSDLLSARYGATK